MTKNQQRRARRMLAAGRSYQFIADVLDVSKSAIARLAQERETDCKCSYCGAPRKDCRRATCEKAKCVKEHATVRRDARRAAHGLHQARTIMRRPELYTQTQVKWAEKRVADEEGSP